MAQKDDVGIFGHAAVGEVFTTRASLSRSHLAFDAQYGAKTDVQTSNEAAVQMSRQIEGALFRLKDMVSGCKIRLSASKRLR